MSTACGYHTAGHSVQLPESVKTIAVPTFKNETLTYRVEQMLTASVVREFTTRTHYRILNGPSEDADATLNGTVLSTVASPLTYDTNTGRAASVLVVVSMKVALTDRSGKVLYQNPAYLFREQYEVSQDLATFFEEDSPAFRRLSQDLPGPWCRTFWRDSEVKPWRTFLALFALIATTACYSGSRPPRVGSAAKEFSVQDSDRKVSLNQFRGQVVVLNFWASWCAPCLSELPSLMSMQAQLRGRGVTVLGVSIDVDEDAYHRFLKQKNVNFMTVRDPDQKVPAMYGTSEWPESYIIDRQGVMRRKVIGPIDWSAPEMLQFLSRL